MLPYPETQIPETLKITSIFSIFRSEYNVSKIKDNGETHSFWEFVFVERGTFNILIDGELFSLSEGQLVIYRPHSFHAVSASHDAVINVVCFGTDSEAMHEFASYIIKTEPHHRSRLSEIIQLGDELFISAPSEKYKGGKILRENTSPISLQQLGNLIELFLLDLYKADRSVYATSYGTFSPDSDLFRRIVEYLKTHVNENVTVKDLCSTFSIGVSSLHRLCKNQCGCGPISLFISIKLSEAKQLISLGKMNFTEISQTLGFSSVHYFSKLFKLRIGMTPSQYLKSISR